LRQSQKMEAIGTLAGGIAHDFNNILAAIIGYGELAQESCPFGSTIAQDLDQILQAGHRAKELVKQILSFSRQAESEKIHFQPAIIVKETIKLLRSSLPTTITIKRDIDKSTALIYADPTVIHQIVMNLCTNAFHAMEEKGGNLSISLKNKIVSRQELVNIPQIQPGNFIQLTIKDCGAGIPPEIMSKIFDPYFTTKETGKGTGMGLAIVHGIIKSYGGFIKCQSQVGEGTVFTILLPAIDKQTETETKQADFAPVGTEHILLVDDEEILVDMGKLMLERLGYRVTTHTSSLEALNAFSNQPEAFDLVITDQTMPGMTGIDLARRMLQIRPEISIIVSTGYSNLMSEEKARSYGIKGFALKPIAKKDIAALIRKVLDEDK
jgi:CheY-like chemotaxis protein/anti-sigma regulatory factor (Ser/Thr protein kinase)